ncbi:MAG: hypothetical protein ACUVR8_09905 [Acidobacteriota bacterium]
MVRENKEQISGWFFDDAERLRLATRVTPNGDVLRVDADRLVEVYGCNIFETASPVRMHADGQQVYMVTNQGSDVDLSRLVLFDPQTGKKSWWKVIRWDG